MKVADVFVQDRRMWVRLVAQQQAVPVIGYFSSRFTGTTRSE
jgi:hypothetical protein